MANKKGYGCRNKAPQQSPEYKRKRRELVKKAYELVLTRGMTQRQVAKEMGIPLSTAHVYIKEARETIPKQSIEDMRREEDDKLNWLYENLQQRIEIDNEAAVLIKDGESRKVKFNRNVARNAEVAVKISERRAKLFGLDEPQQISGQMVNYNIEGVDPGDLT